MALRKCCWLAWVKKLFASKAITKAKRVGTTILCKIGKESVMTIEGVGKLQAIVRDWAVRCQTRITLMCLPSSTEKWSEVQENTNAVCKFGKNKSVFSQNRS